jgi:hypothetical protein
MERWEEVLAMEAWMYHLQGWFHALVACDWRGLLIQQY